MECHSIAYVHIQNFHGDKDLTINICLNKKDGLFELIEYVTDPTIGDVYPKTVYRKEPLDSDMLAVYKTVTLGHVVTNDYIGDIPKPRALKLALHTLSEELAILSANM